MTKNAESTADKQQKRVIGRPFKKGQSGNPAGRPVGSKQKLSESFVSALHSDFQENGEEVIKIVREQDPAAYLRVIASIIPKDFNVNETQTFDFSNISDEDLAAIDSLLSLVAVQNGDDQEEGAGTTH